MPRGRFVGGLWAALVALSLLLSGCGAQSAGTPSALDPAKLAPARSLIYVALTVRPQGNQRSQVETTLRKLFGPHADASARRSIEKALRKTGATYSGDVQPWLGQRIGIVMTQFSPGAGSGTAQAGTAVIAPTQDPAAARSFIAKLMKRSPGTEGRVIGHYAVFGGALAYQEILATTAGTSLAAQPSYQQTVAQLGASPSAVFYLNLKHIVQLAVRRLHRSPAMGSFLHREFARIGPGAAVAAGLTLRPSAISLDTTETGVRPAPSGHGAAADVGRLPAASWLALDTGANAFSGASGKQMMSGFRLGFLGALSRSGAAGSPVAGALIQRLSIVDQVLPALGPLSMSVAGSSPLNLSAGLRLTPGSLPAATRLLAMLHGLAARSPSAQVKGSATHFAVTAPTGASLLVNVVRRSVVATYGFLSQRDFLAPASTLSSNPTYQRALAQLPSQSSVPFYISFAPITALVQLTDRKPSAAKTMRVLNKLSYLIAGGHSGHDRFVLGLK